MAKDQRDTADVLTALLSFCRSGTGKVEHREDNLNRFFCDITEFFMAHVDKKELAMRISNHIASQVEANNPVDDRTLEQIKILILFLNSLYEKYFSREFLKIDISWIVHLIKSDGFFTNPILFKFLADVLVLTFETREARGTNGTLQLLLLLLRGIKGRVETHLRENKETLLFYRKVQRWFGSGSGFVSDSASGFVNESASGLVSRIEEADKGDASDKAPRVGGLPYDVLLHGEEFHFRALCHLFALVTEKLGRKVTEGDTAEGSVAAASPDVERTRQARHRGRSKQRGQGRSGEKGQIGQNDQNGEPSERTAIWRLLQVKSIARDILHLLPFVSNPQMRDVIIKDLCNTAKEYLFSRSEMEEVCLEVTQRMFFCVSHGAEVELDSLNEADVEGGADVVERTRATAREATPMISTYLAHNANCYTKEWRETDVQLLSDVYTYQVLYMDYLYDGKFLTEANLDDVRFFLLLHNRAYTSEEIVKKVIYLFDGIVNGIERIPHRKERGKLHQRGQFGEVWDLYTCILRCMQNFSVHLLKENWHKMVSLLRVVSSIRRKYEAKRKGEWKGIPSENGSSKGSSKEPSKVLSILPDEWHGSSASIQRSLRAGEGTIRGITTARTPTPFDDLDFYIFQCCARRDVEKGQIRFFHLSDFLILRQAELLIWLLLRHSNMTVTRFALFQLVSRGDMGREGLGCRGGEVVVGVASSSAAPLGGTPARGTISPDGSLDVEILLDCMSDTFLFHIFFDECIRPTLFIKGDIPFYEFRLKNLIVSKVLKRKNPLLMAKYFLVGLQGIRFFHVNMRVVLEGLLEALRLLGGGSPQQTDSNWGLNCVSNCALECCSKDDLHEILVSIVKNVKNIPVSRRSDTLTLLFETAIKMNHHVSIFRSVKTYCIFLDTFEDEFFCKNMKLFYCLLKLNMDCMTEPGGGNIPQEGAAFISMKNPTSDIFLSHFIGHFNGVFLSNQHVYFGGYLRLFILLARNTHLKNGSLVLMCPNGEQINELVNRFLFYVLKYGVGSLFDEASLDIVMRELLARTGRYLLSEGVDSPCEWDGEKEQHPHENTQQEDIPLKELLPFVDALEYVLPNSINTCTECIDYYHRDEDIEMDRGASSINKLHSGTMKQKGHFPLPSNHKLVQPKGRFHLETRALHDQCVQYVVNFAEKATQEDATKIILAVSFLANTCGLFSPPVEAVPSEMIIHLQLDQTSRGVSTAGKSEGKERNKDGSEKRYGNKHCEVFNYYKYKYAYKSICRTPVQIACVFGGHVLPFAEKVISDIELCKGELVYVYMIIRRFVIPAVFGDTATGRDYTFRGDHTILGNDPGGGFPIETDERTYILTLLLKQSDILIDRCCACKYPARILELLFITLFHPLIVKHDMALHAELVGRRGEGAARGSDTERNSDDYGAKCRDPTTNQDNWAAHQTGEGPPFLLLNYIQKILQYGQTKLSIVRSAVIPFLSSFIFSLIQNEDMIQVSSDYLDKFVQVIVDILICKEFVLVDSKRSFVNDHYKMKRGNILLHHFLNEQICFYFLSRYENNQEVLLPEDLYRVRHMPIFLRLLALMFLINLFRLLEGRCLARPDGGGGGGKSGEVHTRATLQRQERRTLVRRLYARLLLQIMNRISNKNVTSSGAVPTGVHPSSTPSAPPLPSSSGHNTQLRGLQALCCLAKYFKYLKKTQRKLLISKVNQLLHDDHLSNTRQYLELFCLAVSSSSFVLLYPHLRRNLADGNTNTQLIVSTLIICSYILLKTKFSYYSFEELHVSPSFARVCLSSVKFRMSPVAAAQMEAPHLGMKNKKKRRSKEDTRQIKRIINSIVKKNLNDKDKIVQDVQRCKRKLAQLGRHTGGNQTGVGKSHHGGRKTEQRTTYGGKQTEQRTPHRRKETERRTPHAGKLSGQRTPHGKRIAPPRRSYFFSEYIRKCLVALITRIVALCSSHAALVRSIAQYTFYYFVKGRKEILVDPFFKCTYSYIKHNKDCKRIRKKMKEQFRHWTPTPFDDIRILLPACNYSYNYFDDDFNEESTQTFAHVLRNYELVASYSFIHTVRRAVQQEMSSIMFNVDLERQRREAQLGGAAYGEAHYDEKTCREAAYAVTPMEAIPHRNQNNYQKKFDPISDIIQVNNEFRRTYHQLAKTKTNKKLIVVASLIDKIPNLAGLCRTCEIFKAQKLILHNANIVKDFQFQKISSTANKWMKIGEVKKGDLLKYLMDKKKKYAIVGLEQTKCSVPLNRFSFPEKTILILGDEKEGLPSSVLLFLDHCIEIPGKGIIRSLNVHVSAAITIYEYFKQHLL
ncbi:hypothetical protein C922_03060 [Plasmodium inui San Antonio 1]|uniref:tRNA/rRNA methyltransferase SpoU type domain-containing protein n=1 Tax=Plasmodium inui San Antonio 1 TaxID=1237626 RepID=W7AM78_9APIC|nr:hypothetical protein C922_03060 [Plasmodium inui San Antonio 1]EUD66426.1 hypothetical protein C922_03060 [Plasmodium inui San Antonio 1]